MEYLRINFNQMFNFLENGKIEPKARIRIGSIEFEQGIKIGRGVQFSGVDLFEWIKKDLAVTKEGDVWVIHGYYD